jgi:hypothetical protein
MLHRYPSLGAVKLAETHSGLIGRFFTIVR